MHRLSGFVVAGALVLLAPTQSAFAQAAAAAQKTTFNGEIALWSFAIKADQTMAYEQVIAKLKAALQKSEKPEAKQMLASWKVMKGATVPQGVVYTHILHPVVKDADYTIMSIIYEAFPDPTERNATYELYRGAFSAALGANVGTIVADFSK